MRQSPCPPYLLYRLYADGAMTTALLQVAFTRYGDRSRRQRRLMVKALGPSAIPTYHPLLEIETQALLKRLVDEPMAYAAHIRRYVVLHIELCPEGMACSHGWRGSGC